MTDPPGARDLRRYEAAYRDSRFEAVQARYRKRLLLELLARLAPAHILEVGCGLDTLANHWRDAERFVVVEPSAGFAEQARRDLAGRRDATVLEATLDAAAGGLTEGFDLILLSGLLQELPDCGPTLEAARTLCGKDTVVHVNVSNANSFHRLLAAEMGLIARVDELSDLQRKLQQHSVFTLDSLKALLEHHGLRSFEEGSYFVKPFTHAQMQALVDGGLMTEAVLDGLWGMARHMPGLGSEIFVNARLAIPVRPDRIRLLPYVPEHAGRWNAFVAASKNGTFLIDRNYMDYHADRFVDASFIAFAGESDEDVVALLPGSRHGDRIVSHGGLTYGGWISDRRMTVPAMLRLFDLLAEQARRIGVRAITYKAIPRCYHRLPAEEDLYALFRRDAVLVRQDVGSVVDLAAAPAWAARRNRALAKARAEGIEVVFSTAFAPFVESLAGTLARHDATPVHSAAELEMLAARFPDRIRLYAARRGSEAVAHVLLYDCGQTVHTQYLAASEAGRACGGLDAIIDHIQHVDYPDRRYLSFGISTEQEGRVLNEGLIDQKEMFGGRAMVCPFYELELA